MATVLERPLTLGQPNSRGERYLGTMTSADLNRTPTGFALNRRPSLTGATPASGYTTYTPRPAEVARVARTPLTRPDFSQFAPGSIGEQNAMNNAGVYAPGSFGASNAEANATGFAAPQQTERANPLVGDAQAQPQSTTTRLPYNMRGSRIPFGSDALPSPVRDTLSVDTDIENEMNKTFDTLRGTQSSIRRRFAGGNQPVDPYATYVRTLGGQR